MNTRIVLFWVCAALIAAAELLILRAALFPTTLPPSERAQSGPVPQPARGIEILWGVLPAFALGALLWAAWRALQ